MTKESMNGRRLHIGWFSVREEAVSHLVSVRQVGPVSAVIGSEVPIRQK